MLTIYIGILLQVFGVMNTWVLICTHKEKTCDCHSKRFTLAQDRVVLTSETSFLIAKLPV